MFSFFDVLDGFCIPYLPINIVPIICQNFGQCCSPTSTTNDSISHASKNCSGYEDRNCDGMRIGNGKWFIANDYHYPKKNSGLKSGAI